MPTWMRLRALTAALLSACAALEPPELRPGMDTAAVQRQLGAVTARYPLTAALTRLEFASGPYGRTTWMVDVDGGGRVVTARQVLTEAHFADFQQRATGMTRAELLRTLGRPGERRGAGLRGGEVWSWRYPTNDCLWFEATVGDDAIVRDSGYGIDPRCDAPSDARD
ncbi:MAG: hypothetical protein Q8N44_13405 [Rubrivivax sp.]|nr:hypothetical protein [Rubrivivax sp.]